MIEWIPIAEMPDELRDGRDVLVCRKNTIEPYRVVRFHGQKWYSVPGCWQLNDATHYAEINAPEKGQETP